MFGFSLSGVTFAVVHQPLDIQMNLEKRRQRHENVEKLKLKSVFARSISYYIDA